MASEMGLRIRCWFDGGRVFSYVANPVGQRQQGRWWLGRGRGPDCRWTLSLPVVCEDFPFCDGPCGTEAR